MVDYLDLIRKVMQGEAFMGLVRYRQKKSGALLTCSISLAPQRDERGEPTGVTAIVEDITARKQTEDELRTQKEILQNIFDHTPMMIGMIGADGQWQMVNRAWERTIGWTLEELQQPDFDVLAEVYPDPQEHQRVMDFIAAKSGKWEEFKVRTRDGRLLDVTFTNVYLSDGTTLGFGLDITERKQVEAAIRKSEQVLREAESLGHTGSWEQNLVTGEIFNTEENLRLFFGDDPHKGANFEDYAQVVHPDDREYVLQRRIQLLEEEGPSDIEYRVVWPDGSVHVIFGRATVVRDERNRPIRVYGTNVDITERKQAEEEMNRQAERAGTLARIAARLNKQLDLDAVIHAVCEEAINTFKVSQATMSLYDKKSDLLVYAGGINIPPEYAATMAPITRSRFDDFLRTMGPIMVVPDIQSMPDLPNAELSYRLDVRTVVTTAMLRDQELVGVLVVGVNGHVREFDNDELTLLKAISDQAAQAIANAMLLKAANEQHEQLRALSAKLVETQETERRALTTELHDRVGQNLTGLSINLQNMKVLLSDETAKTLAAKFDDAQALVEHITRQIRDIMAELYLPELEDYGLAAALETYAERAAARGNLELITDLLDLSPPPLPSDVRTALFRAAQEAISNVLKHADATQLEIRLEEENGRLRLQVEDDGQGFEPEAPSQKESPSWGLKIMRERIESIGGKVQIESEPGQGTRVTFEIERPS
jgi:PAS domain S-box-containing protein